MNKNESQSIKIVNGWLKRKILNYDLWNFEDIQSNYDLDIYCDICSKKIFGIKPFLVIDNKLYYLLGDKCFQSHKNCSCCTSLKNNEKTYLCCYNCYFS